MKKTNANYQYRIHFSENSAFQTAKTAFQARLKELNFENPKVSFDERNQTVDFDYSFFQLFVYFGKDENIARQLPLSWYAPTTENLAVTTKGKPFHITRKIDLKEEFNARIEAAETLLKQWPAETTAKPTTLTAALETAATIALGERHCHSAPRQFLIENMQLLAKKSYPIVLEHMFKSQQAMLDQWFNSSPDAPMPGELKEIVEFFDRAFDRESKQTGGSGTGKYGFKDLLLSAKKHGVKIIAFEDELSMMAAEYAHYHPLATELKMPAFYNRIALMNVNVYETVQAESLTDKPFIAFVGAAHTVPHYDGRHYVPGLATMFGGISAIIADDPSLYPKDSSYEQYGKCVARADIPVLTHAGSSYRDDWTAQLAEKRQRAEERAKSPSPL